MNKKIPPWIIKAKGNKTNPNERNSKSKNYNLYVSKEWRALSIETRTLNPQCNMCNRLFVEIKSNLVIDHIIPIEQNGAIWHPNNHQVLCIKCHNKKTGLDQRGYNKPFRWITEEDKKRKIPM